MGELVKGKKGPDSVVTRARSQALCSFSKLCPKFDPDENSNKLLTLQSRQAIQDLLTFDSPSYDAPLIPCVHPHDVPLSFSSSPRVPSS